MKIVTIIRKIFILPIYIYRYSISYILPNACRHTPTCSQYAIQAIMYHGIIRGCLLTAWRLLRCNPWGTYGFDPVPPPNFYKIRRQLKRARKNLNKEK